MPTIPSTTPILLRPRDAASALAISQRTLWTLTAGGQIPCIRLGRSVRYSAAELRRWAQTRQFTVTDTDTTQ